MEEQWKIARVKAKTIIIIKSGTLKSDICREI